MGKKFSIYEKRTDKGNPSELQALSFQVRESYKTARTNIEYSIIKKGCKKIAFTSSSKSEGKTITSTNVAFALSQQVDTKVLIVDCDLRRPHIHAALNIAPTPGLTNYFNNECALEDIIKPTGSENLYAVCYGAIPPNPSELLASDAMKEFVEAVEKEFNYIIFDTPPVSFVIDAVPVVKLSDGVVVVARNNSTTNPELTKAVDFLNRAGGKVLGVIINRVKMSEVRKRKGKDYSYGYYEY